MKKKINMFKHVTSFGMALIILLTAVLSGVGVISAKADLTGVAVTGSPLMISGVMADTNNLGGSDAYEYVEIYNTSNFDIKLDDYQLHYSYGTTDSVWGPDQNGIVIKAGKSIVLWIINSANTALLPSDFNTYYGTNLVLGETLVTMHNNGLHNSSERYLSITSKLGETLCRVKYNDNNVKAVKLNCKIAFSYDLSSIDETRIGYDSTEVPGSVLDVQKPAQVFEFKIPSDISATISANATLIPDDVYKASIRVTGSNRIIAADLHLKGETDGNETVIPMKLENGNITASMPYSTLEDKKNLTAYATVYDGVTTVTTSSVTTSVMTNADFYPNPSPLVITEILPDSSNINGADAFEYIEVYNNSNENISFKDYKLYYNYPDNGDSSDVMWESIPSDTVIAAGKTLIFWIKNGSNNQLTANDFNTKFGTSLVAGADLVEIYCGGMANSSARALRLTTNVKEQMDFISYNMNGADDTTADKSIQFQYSMLNGKSVMKVNSALPTPGSVSENERPIKSVSMGVSSMSPVVADMTATSFSNSNEFMFALKAEAGSRSIKTVELHVKDNSMAEFEIYNLLSSSDSLFTKIIDALDLSYKSSYTYFFIVSDGVNSIKTNEKTITTHAPSKNQIQLNVTENQIISGEQSILASALDVSKPIQLFVNQQDVTKNTIPSLEKSAIIAFDVSQTDTFFKNALAIGDNLIGVFDEGTYTEWNTIVYEIPVEYFVKGQNITASIHAGNKANPLEHNEENNDDFVVKNIRLILPDGKTLRASGYEEPDNIISMGDSAGKIEILDAVFSVTDDSYTGIRYTWNTQNTTDGSQVIEANCGTNTLKTQAIVDNTAPVITSNMENKQYKGDFTIVASALDATTQVTDCTAALDGKKVNLPLKLSSATLLAGEHSFTVTATDAAGNVAKKEIVFTVPVESPNLPDSIHPINETNVDESPTLSVSVSDPTNDEMTVTFKSGEHYNLGDEQITTESGISQCAGSITSTPITDGYPYLTYNITVGSTLADDELAGIHWSGEANTGSVVNLYAYSKKDSKWTLIKTVTTDSNGKLTIDAELLVGDYRDGNAIQIMIQNGLGYTPTQYTAGTAANVTSNTVITTSNASDTDRNAYDFTFAVQSDTQYYNENLTDIYRHQVNINDWLVANQPRMNIQYVFDDGDIVDDVSETYEWQNADNAFKILDNAKLPYGVLAGNHDVGHKAEDYTAYGMYFGESRYNVNPWYGDSYKNNKGHYDLISVDGIDFIMLYMGWGIDDEEINWMNQVLAQFPERKAILNFHEYLLTTNGLGEIPKRIYDEVVATNPNVCMVLSGHYHSATTRIDQFDDNQDGIMDRSVYQMLFDYQGLPEGGRGFIRLMHFSLESQTITVRTYSPSEDSYSSGVLPSEQENFTIKFADIGIVPTKKILATTSFSVDIYTNQTIGTVQHVKSGDTATITWNNISAGKHGWYAKITDAFGGVRRTSVQYVNKSNEVTNNPSININDSLDHNNYVDAGIQTISSPATGDKEDYLRWILLGILSIGLLGVNVVSWRNSCIPRDL